LYSSGLLKITHQTVYGVPIVPTTARYRLSAVDPQQRLYRGEIDHPPWLLQWAEAEIETNSMTHAHGIHLP
jgi:uncharacterized protein YqjF (DUF2071 family)